MRYVLGLLLPLSLLSLAAAAMVDEHSATESASRQKLAEYRQQSNLAHAAVLEQDYAAALRAGEAMLQLARELLPDDSPVIIEPLQLLAQCEERRENWVSAEARREEILKRMLKAFGETDYRTTEAQSALRHLARLRALSPAELKSLRELDVTERQAVALHTAGNYEKAVQLATGVVQQREKLLGGEDPATATSLGNLAGIYLAQAQYPRAEPLFKRALEIREKALGAEHPETATALNNLGVLYKSQGNYAAAEPLYQRALRVREKVLGLEHSDTATTLNTLAVLYDEQGKPADAEPLYRRALQIREKVLGPEHPETATSLNNLALHYEAQGNLAAAEPLLQRALAIREKTLGSEHPETATIRNNLADLFRTQGEFAAAEPLLQQALQNTEKSLGPDHPLVAISLSNLGRLYRDQGNHAAAEPLYRRAVQILEKLAPDHPATATALGNLAACLQEEGKYADAEALCQHALRIRQKALGTEHPDTATSVNNLGELYRLQQKYNDAEPLLRQALKSTEAALRPDHPSTAVSLNNLAGLLLEMHRLDEAEPLLKRALELLEHSAASDPQSAVAVVSNLAALYDEQGRPQIAEPLYRRALFDSLRHLERTSVIQTEQQQLTMQRMLVHRLNAYLSCLSRLPNRDEAAFAAVLNWKGATLLRQRAMRLVADEPELVPLFQELQTLTRQWIAAGIAIHPTETEAAKAFDQQLARLRDHKDRLEIELSRRCAAYRASAQTFTVPQLQSSLPEGAVLIDYLEYVHFEPNRKPERRLLAFMVAANGPVRWRHLGPISRIAESIDVWRESLGTTPASMQAGQTLRAAIWQPLLSDMGPATLVLISPDGALGRLPFAALPGREPGRYLLEDHRLSLVPAPQLIPAMVQHTTPQQKHDLLLVGDVDYDSQTVPTEPAAGGRKRRRRDADADRAVRDLSGGLKWERLPGSRTEVAAIKDLYERQFEAAADDVVELREQAATEEAFRRLAPQSTLLHVATHGYFAAADRKSALHSEVIADARGLPFGQHPDTARGHSPGLLSGLVLSGANHPPPAPLAGVESRQLDDGYLTADEIAVLPLDGVDLVVLSACETGLGEVAGGEGMLGLQRSFQIAGARSVVASLWKVPDKATAVLVQRFYENRWKREMSQLDALREAQIWMLHDEGSRGLLVADDAKQNPRTIPPYYWAAFVLSGDWR